MGAVCTPSRNMLLSGRAYFRWTGPQAPGDPPNFPLSMKAAGYETYHHGKRANTALNIQDRFDLNRYLKNDLEDRTDGEPGRSIIDDAIRYLEQRKEDRPFFMYLAFGNPHDPRVAAQKYLDLYRREDIPLPKNFLPVHPFDNGEMTIRDELLAPWPRTEAEIRRHLHEYYAVISGLDHHIGRLLDVLKARGQAEKTIVIFSADQGLAIGSHGLMGKQNLYDDGMKVPLVFAGPGIPKGRSEALVYLHDIYPTVCELAGTSVPPGLDGVSFKGVLDGRTNVGRDTLFFSYRNVQRAIRDRDWKLIRYPEINRTQLFNLREDPDETRDLSGDPHHEARIAAMMAGLRAWQETLGDKLALTSGSPRPAPFEPPTGDALDKLHSRWKTGSK
jgi:arylsulfatase A-like enzyme